MGIMVRERAAQESALMEQRQHGDYLCGALIQPEPQLPCGWEKCLDLKSGLIYFKDWNSGTLTYRDPRQTVVPLAAQRIGLLSISLSSENNANNNKNFKRSITKPEPASQRLPWTFSTAQTTTDGDSSATETTTTTSVANDDDDDHSLELSLNLPGTSSSRTVPPPPPVNSVNSNQEESVCTMEKVRSALERSNWLNPKLPKKRSSSSEESNSRSHNLNFSTSSPSTSSQCSDSECFTSPSVMSYDGDDEEVQQQQPSLGKQLAFYKHGSSAAATPSSSKSEPEPEEVMVIVGCKSCLMYVMLSKAHPCCPKCGNTDVLLELPVPAAASVPSPKMKKQRLVDSSCSSPTWSWCTASRNTAR